MIFSFFSWNKSKSVHQPLRINTQQQEVRIITYRRQLMSTNVIPRQSNETDTDEEDLSQKGSFLQIGTSETSKLINHRNWVQRRRMKSVQLRNKKVSAFEEFDHLDQISNESPALNYQNMQTNFSLHNH